MANALEKITALRESLTGPPSFNADTRELALRTIIGQAEPFIVNYMPQDPADVDAFLDAAIGELKSLHSDGYVEGSATEIPAETSAPSSPPAPESAPTAAETPPPGSPGSPVVPPAPAHDVGAARPEEVVVGVPLLEALSDPALAQLADGPGRNLLAAIGAAGGECSDRPEDVELVVRHKHA